MYHGIGTDEHDRDEIADFLNVRRSLVDEYLDETPQSDEIKRVHDSIGEQTRNEMIMEKRDRLRQLRELEEQLRDAVEIVVTDFEFKPAKLDIKSAPGKGIGVDQEEDNSYDGEVPVPKRVKEVPQFDRLQAVWEEMRKTENELAKLMGLNEPEELSVEGNVVDQKFYQIDEDPGDGFPEQEVKELSEEESV
jgi:hypothetical protein